MSREQAAPRPAPSRDTADLAEGELPDLAGGERADPVLPASEPPPRSAPVVRRPVPWLLGLRRGSRSRALVRVAVGAAVLGVTAFLGFHHRPPQSAEIALTVMTQPSTTVKVVPFEAGEPAFELGVNPVKKGGVHVGDTVQLVNADLGIFAEEQIPFGEPGEEKVIEKRFFRGHAHRRHPPPVDPATCPLYIYRRGNRLGVPGVRLKLYEGRQALELRGDCLKAPVSFVVNIAPEASRRATVEVDPWLNKQWQRR